MPRIWPLAWWKADRSTRADGYGEAVLPPGGARLASILCQRFGRPSQTRPWPDSRCAFRSSPRDSLYRETSMMEDCATSMSAPQGCTDDMAVVESFKEALKGRVGADRYRMWFTHGVGFAVQSRSASLDRNMIGGVGAESRAITESVCGDRSADAADADCFGARSVCAGSIEEELPERDPRRCDAGLRIKNGCTNLSRRTEPRSRLPLPLIDSAEDSDLDQADSRGEEPNIKPDRTPIDFGFAAIHSKLAFTASWFTARNSIEAARFDQSRVAIARRGKWQVAWQIAGSARRHQRTRSRRCSRSIPTPTCFARKRRIAR